MSILATLCVLTTGCVHCGAECMEARKPKQAAITDGCPLWSDHDCKKKADQSQTVGTPVAPTETPVVTPTSP